MLPLTFALPLKRMDGGPDWAWAPRTLTPEEGTGSKAPELCNSWISVSPTRDAWPQLDRISRRMSTSSNWNKSMHTIVSSSLPAVLYLAVLSVSVTNTLWKIWVTAPAFVGKLGYNGLPCGNLSYHTYLMRNWVTRFALWEFKLPRLPHGKLGYKHLPCGNLSYHTYLMGNWVTNLVLWERIKMHYIIKTLLINRNMRKISFLID